jgi:CHRD domain-containing protein
MKGLLSAAAATALLTLAGCAAGGPANQRATLLVTMNGIQEVPGPGDPDGSGTVEVRVEPREGQVCWNLYARGIDPATAAHIHRGAAGMAGPPVVVVTTPDAAGRSQGCASVDAAVAREIAMRGHDFYVNVHTAPHPAGAIRGQLRGGPRRQERVVRPSGR